MNRKKTTVIVIFFLLLMHVFVAWIFIYYPEPDSTLTHNLWSQGYVEAGLPHWKLPWFVEKTFLLWFPFWVSTEIIDNGFTLPIRLCASFIGWVVFLQTIYWVTWYFRRKYHKIKA